MVLHKCSWSNAKKLVVSIGGSIVGSAPRKLLLRLSSSDDDLLGSINRPLLHGSILGAVGISLIRQRDFDSQVCVMTSRDLTLNP